MKKKFLSVLATTAVLASLAGCQNQELSSSNSSSSDFIGSSSSSQNEEGIGIINMTRYNADGFASGKISNRLISETDTKQYVKVSTPMEFLDALKQTNADGEYEVKVIEVMNDLELGYNEIGQDVIDKYNNNGLTNFVKNRVYVGSSLFNEVGVSQIEISNRENLTIYSKNGAKIKHAGFKITRCKDVSIRNLQFDELWEWEDTATNASGKIGDYDRHGWSYFKINFSENIWFDHCTFGKAYDGLIDSENESKGIHISWCQFLGGDVSEGSYIYEMMDEVKAHYNLRKQIEAGEITAPEDYDLEKNKYYAFLRDSGISHEVILNAICAPQKKGFLIGGGDTPDDDQWKSNKTMSFSIANSYFKNLQDRLPRVRGANAYVYNTILDCESFYEARMSIKNMDNYDEIMATVSANSWKLALVSQGMVTTNEAAVKYENVIFKGVSEAIKANNKDNSNTRFTGKYCVENSRYILGDYVYTGNSGELNTPWVNVRHTPTIDFRWNTEGGIEPFNVEKIDLDNLEKDLLDPLYGSGSGVLTFGDSFWLKAKY